MNHYYEDILSRITDPPKWWDEKAAPRYCDFNPFEVSNIYADEVCLLEIRCQQCRRTFQVAMSQDPLSRSRVRAKRGAKFSLATTITKKAIHYGDPPNIRCCPAGPTMNSAPIRVLEYWARDEQNINQWDRDAKLEIIIEEEAAA